MTQRVRLQADTAFLWALLDHFETAILTREVTEAVSVNGHCGCLHAFVSLISTDLASLIPEIHFALTFFE